MYGYLSAGDHEMADQYNNVHTRDLGTLYGDYVVDVIQYESDDPPGPEGDEQDGEESHHDSCGEVGNSTGRLGLRLFVLP